MKLTSNSTTIIVVAMALVTIYFITKSDIFQMEYYKNIHAENPGNKF